MTASEDLFVAWRLDPSACRAAEVARAANPLLSPGRPPAGVRFLRDGCTVLAAGPLMEGALPLLRLGPAGLGVCETLLMKGGDAKDAIEVDDGGGASGAGSPSNLIMAAAPNRAFLWDRRAGGQPCARLALQGITALASVVDDAAGEFGGGDGGGDAAGGGWHGHLPSFAAYPVLLAAAGSRVHVYDVRRLPQDSAAVKKPPPALATLTRPPPPHAGEAPPAPRDTPRDTPREASFTTLAMAGGAVVAGDMEGQICVWDVHKETTTQVP